MANAHVICPEFFGANLRNPNTAHVLLGKLMGSDDQIVIDREERLLLGYLESVKDDVEAFVKYKAWVSLLDGAASGKKLVSSSLDASSRQEIVMNTISQAVTTRDKSIVVHDSNCYAGFIDEINRQHINMFHLHDLSQDVLKCRFTRVLGYASFESDLFWGLHRTARLGKRAWTEDEINDLLREMLASMGRNNGYEVRDQAREGESSSGKGAGELDILVENCGLLYTIVEAMKLSSLDSGYIKGHYMKLLTKYNPLQVQRTYLVSYYTGSNFDGWWKKYSDYISLTPVSEFTGQSSSETEEVSGIDPKYPNLRGIQHIFRHSGQICICTHFGLNFVGELKS